MTLKKERLLRRQLGTSGRAWPLPLFCAVCWSRALQSSIAVRHPYPRGNWFFFLSQPNNNFVFPPQPPSVTFPDCRFKQYVLIIYDSCWLRYKSTIFTPSTGFWLDQASVRFPKTNLSPEPVFSAILSIFIGTAHPQYGNSISWRVYIKGRPSTVHPWWGWPLLLQFGVWVLLCWKLPPSLPSHFPHIILMPSS